MVVLSFAPLQFVSSIPLATRVFAAATVLFSLLYYFLQWSNDGSFSAPYLVLIPGSSLFYPWTLLTSAFAETSIIEVRATYIDVRDCILTCILAHIYPTRYTRVFALPGEALGSS